MISYCCSLPKYQIDSPPGLISETCTSQGTSNGQIGQRFSALENKKNALCSAKIACSAHKGLQKTALKAQRGSKSQQNPKRPGQKGSTTRRARAIPSTLLLRSTLYLLIHFDWVRRSCAKLVKEYNQPVTVAVGVKVAGRNEVIRSDLDASAE